MRSSPRPCLVGEMRQRWSRHRTPGTDGQIFAQANFCRPRLGIGAERLWLDADHAGAVKHFGTLTSDATREGRAALLVHYGFAAFGEPSLLPIRQSKHSLWNGPATELGA